MIKNYFALIAGLITLVTGYAYYLLVRGFDPLGLFNLNAALWPHLNIVSPSFFHVLALSLISFSLIAKHRFAIAIFWLVVNWVFEFSQAENVLFTSSGTFDVFDIIATLIASLLFLLLLNLKAIKQQNDSFRVAKPISYFLNILVIAMGFTSIVASDDGGSKKTTSNSSPCNSIDCNSSYVAPVQLSYSIFREPTVIESSRPMPEPGKIYSYNNHLFINERNKGIHVYDNTDPINPTAIGFLEIEGNLEIAIKDGFLFADSFIDLIVFDLSNSASPNEVKRIEGIFPYDAYQVIGSDEDVYLGVVDESKGVVVGYETK